METGVFWDLGCVSDQQLRAGLATLLASGYRTEARIIAHIAEVEERKIHAKDGSPSLFDYCVRRLGLSESEAFHRLTAARIGRRFPVVFAMIERREIHLTAVCLLRDYLTPENHLELLAEAAGKTKLQVQELLARRFPRPDVASYVRKLPSHAEPAKQASTPVAEPAKQASTPPAPRGTGEASEHSSFAPTLAPTLAPPPTRPLIEPTSEARYRIQLNASAALKEKLELFQALVSHSVPNGDVALVLERALDLALQQVQKRRFAKTDTPHRPRQGRGLKVKRASAHREHIPNATQREIATRDALQCTYVSDGGCRCSARAFLQIHHEKPWARGGSSRPENLRLLCAIHNRLLAERDFGVAHAAERAARGGKNGRHSKAQAPVRPNGAKSSPNGGRPHARPAANRAPSSKAVDLVGSATREIEIRPGEPRWQADQIVRTRAAGHLAGREAPVRPDVEGPAASCLD